MTALIVFCAKYLIAGILAGAAAAAYVRKEWRTKLLLRALVALPLAYGLARLAGILYGHSQPFAELGFEPLVPHETDNSFPSDHTAFGAALSSLVFLADRRLGIILWLLTLCVGAARVAAGLHWTIDIFAAAIIGLLAALVAHAALSKFSR